MAYLDDQIGSDRLGNGARLVEIIRRGFVRCLLLVLFYVILKSRPEFGECIVVIDPSHALLDLQKAQSHLALPLVRMHPTGDLAEVSPQQTVDVLDGVRRPEGASELFEQAHPAKGQGFLQPFHQSPRDAAVELLQFAVDREQGLFGLPVSRTRECSILTGK